MFQEERDVLSEHTRRNFILSFSFLFIFSFPWAQLAAPLLMGNDPRNLEPEFRDILQHNNLIQINQDPLGIQGRRIQCDNTGCPKKSDSCSCHKIEKM